MDTSNLHVSVLKNEIREFFNNITIKTFFDGTVGAAGHTFDILSNHKEIEKAYCFDKDTVALEIAKQKLVDFSDKVQLVNASFCEVRNYVKEPVDAILLDLGVSTMQLKSKTRGFSFGDDSAVLDMRMNTSIGVTAADIVNEYTEAEIGHIIKTYGEEWKWKRAAEAIVTVRERKEIKTVGDLKAILEPVLGKKMHFMRINPLTKVFQALRIQVNNELDDLTVGLNNLFSKLSVGGRFAVISFHSLEDRIVKYAFKDLQMQKKLQIVTKKPITPSEEEVKINKASRSAKLRVIERIA